MRGASQRKEQGQGLIGKHLDLFKSLKEICVAEAE
jgi:hypothetical protein